jgi:hypothetical protein
MRRIEELNLQDERYSNQAESSNENKASEKHDLLISPAGSFWHHSYTLQNLHLARMRDLDAWGKNTR